MSMASCMDCGAPIDTDFDLDASVKDGFKCGPCRGEGDDGRHVAGKRYVYEMSQAQLDKILDACKSVPLIMLQCGMPASPQENANRAWQALGNEMGFDHMTVEPTGQGDRFFSALSLATGGSK